MKAHLKPAIVAQLIGLCMRGLKRNALETIVSSIPTGIMIIEKDSGKITHFSIYKKELTAREFYG